MEAELIISQQDTPLLRFQTLYEAQINMEYEKREIENYNERP